MRKMLSAAICLLLLAGVVFGQVMIPIISSSVWVPIGGGNLTSGSGGDTTGTHTTASISPSPRSLVVVCIGHITFSDTFPPEPSVSGLGFTWNTAQSWLFDNVGFARGRVSTIWAYTGESPGSGTLGISWGGVGGRQPYVVDQFTSVTGSPVVQSATGTSSVSLSPFSGGDNRPYICGQSDGATTTPESGYTKLAQVTVNADTSASTAWRSDATDTTPSWSSAGSPFSIALEVASSGE